MYQEFLSNGEPEATLYSVATSDGTCHPGYSALVLRQKLLETRYMRSVR